MRRAIAAGVTGGLILGGSVAIPALAAVPAATSGPAATARPAMKTVTYAGYAFQVPAGWPVYRLDEHPQTCVRYDVHAVYLGTPGANMDCPAGIVGRTQAVSFIPAGNAGPGNAGPAEGRPSRRLARPAAAGIEQQRLPAVHSPLSRNADQHELEVALGAAGAGGTVLGTYGAAPGVIEQVLNTLRLAPAGAAQTAPQRVAGPLVPCARPPGCPVRRRRAPRPKIYTSWRGVPADWPTEIVQPPRPVTHPVGGFDACTAPSLATMRVWRRAYAAVGAYIGGVNAACAYGNLSASWIRSVAAMGWGVLPTYVGPQAPCWNGGTGVRISPRKAVAQGYAAGLDAVRDARYFGLAPGSPIYYDLEAYTGGTTCKQAILRVPRRVGPQRGRQRLPDGRLLEQGLGNRQHRGVDRGPQSGVHPAGRDLDRAVGRHRVAQRRRAGLAADRADQAVRGQRHRDRRRDQPQHRQGHRGRPGGPLTRAIRVIRVIRRPAATRATRSQQRHGNR